MKKLILAFVAIAITAGAYAQTDSTNKKGSSRDMNNKQVQNQNLQNNLGDKSTADGLVMQNGKIMQVKNGQTTLLDRDMTMSNGTKVMSDGNYINKDGSKMMLKEGQHMDLSGNVSTLKSDKDKNMYLIPDSIKKDN